MDRVFEILRNTFPTVNFEDGHNLISGGKIDSLGIITIVMTLGDVYNITFEPDDISIDNFNSVENIWGLIKKKKPDA